MQISEWNPQLHPVAEKGFMLTIVQLFLKMGKTQVSSEVGGTEPAGEYTLFYVKGFILRKRIVLRVKKVEFVSDRISYIILRGPWCRVIVLNFHALTQDKSDDVRDSCY
jgi:hypothetical protein